MEGAFAGILYIIIYLISTIGIFYSFYIVRSKQLSSLEGIEFKNYNSLKKINPCLVFLLSINFLSMAGIPPLSGFISKYFIFESLVEINNISIVSMLIIISMLSAYYYIRPIKLLIFNKRFNPKFFADISSLSAYILVFIFLFNLLIILEPRLIFSIIENILITSFIF